MKKTNKVLGFAVATLFTAAAIGTAALATTTFTTT